MTAVARARRLPPRPEGYEPLRPIEGRPRAERARRFLARLSEADLPSGAPVEASDFLQAALTFAETCAASDATTLTIAVTDAETGETQRFAVAVE